MNRSMRVLSISATAVLLATGVAVAQGLTIDINRISEAGVGDKIGTVQISEAKDGVTFKIAVNGVPQGAKKSHKGPNGAGHKGDLPLLNATNKGIDQTVAVARLKLADVQGRALVIHEGGDNYTDNPENGGGKGRIACGVVPKQ